MRLSPLGIEVFCVGATVFSDSIFIFDVDLLIDGRERLAADVLGTVGAKEFDFEGSASVGVSGDKDTRPAADGAFLNLLVILLDDPNDVLILVVNIP